MGAEQEILNLKRRIGELEQEYERWYHKALDLQFELNHIRDMLARFLSSCPTLKL
jgi:regulator of replication initiation timing